MGTGARTHWQRTRQAHPHRYTHSHTQNMTPAYLCVVELWAQLIQEPEVGEEGGVFANRHPADSVENRVQQLLSFGYAQSADSNGKGR